MLGKNTILKAIHNPYQLIATGLGLRMLGKNTILKAIHNGITGHLKIEDPANAR